jgi:hypothetical protein
MSTDLSTIVGTVIPTIAGLFALFWGAHTYSDGQLLKRKEIIFPLIEEYEKSKNMRIAKKILDDCNLNLNEVLDKQNSSSQPKSNNRYYNKIGLKTILRAHNPNLEYSSEFDDGEKAIRDSFDSLLAFFSKLEYLLKIHLIKEQEVFYFRYFVEKAAELPAVLEYVDRYQFQLDGTLDHRIKNTRLKRQTKFIKLNLIEFARLPTFMPSSYSSSSNSTTTK